MTLETEVYLQEVGQVMINSEFSDYFMDSISGNYGHETNIKNSIKRYTSAGWTLLNISSHKYQGVAEYTLHYYKLKEKQKTTI